MKLQQRRIRCVEEHVIMLTEAVINVFIISLFSLRKVLAYFG